MNDILRILLRFVKVGIFLAFNTAIISGCSPSNQEIESNPTDDSTDTKILASDGALYSGIEPVESRPLSNTPYELADPTPMLSITPVPFDPTSMSTATNDAVTNSTPTASSPMIRREHQEQLIAAIEDLGLTDIMLGDSGGIRSANVWASTSDSAVSYQIVLSDNGFDSPSGSYRQTGVTKANDVHVVTLDRNGVEVAWFKCTDIRIIEIRALKGTFEDALMLVPDLYSALNCNV